MKSIPLFAVLMLVVFTVNAQVEHKRVVPSHPNVASLFKSVITPVNEYSGLPNVSIPLYTVNEGEISLPISLNYHTGGIQVTEESGIVGLGWALNAGGAITRTINDRDDFETGNGWLAPSNTREHPDVPLDGTGHFNPDTGAFVNGVTDNSQCKFYVNNSLTTFDIPTGPVEIYEDLMPDTFHFNFNGYSGSFYFKKDGLGVDVHLVNKKGIDVKWIQDGNEAYFKIITEDGFQYTFNETAVTSFPNHSIDLDSYISTWFLTEIRDTAGNIIELEYSKKKDDLTTTRKLKPLRSFTQTYSVPIDQGTPGNPGYQEAAGPETEIEDVLLTEIKFRDRKVRFNYSPERVPGPNNPPDARKDVNGHYLQNLQVINEDLTVVYSFDFNYSYFGTERSYDYSEISLQNGDFGQTIGALDDGMPDINLRLRLDGITKNGIEKHHFAYHNAFIVPNKTSMAQDYWGFYNYAVNSQSFIPQIRNPDVTAQSSPLVFNQFNPANRIPDNNFAKLFSLREITYPTGGSTEFDYELNTFMANSNLTGTINAPTVLVQDFVEANESTPSSSITLRPNPNATLKLFYGITIRGWNRGSDPTDPLPKPNITTSHFQDNIVVLLKDSNGYEVHRQHIPSSMGNTLWSNYDPCGYTNTDPNCDDAGSPAIAFEFEEFWNYGNPTSYYNLTDSEYTLEVYFDDMQGQLYGQTLVRYEFEGEVVDDTRQYSVGGGLRVKSLTEKDNSGVQATKTNYNYHYFADDNGVQVERSYGRIKTMPNYFTSHKVSYYVTDFVGGGYAPNALPVIVGSAASHNAFSKDAGSYVGYDQVEVTSEGTDGDNGKTIKKFYNEEDTFRAFTNIDYVDDNYQYPPIRVPHNGLLKTEEVYKKTDLGGYVKIRETEHDYEINGIDATGFSLSDLYTNTDYIISASREIPFSHPNVINAPLYVCEEFQIQLYPHYSNLIQQTGITERVFDEQGNNPVVTTQEFAYENNSSHWQRTKTTVSQNDGSFLETKIYYPNDISSATSLNEGGPLTDFGAIQDLGSDAQHQIATPIQTVQTRIGPAPTSQREVLSVQRNEYGQFGTYDDSGTPVVLKTLRPVTTAISKGNATVEPRLQYLDYLEGKPLEVRKENGIDISYIWGYNNTYPIAKIENASYDDLAAALPTIPGLTITTGVDVKNLDETHLSYIDGLRGSHPEFMITTFVYEPLIGVTSITDPRGYIMHYEYDGLRRLKTVRDDLQHPVTDYLYHYIGQPDTN
ncbi:hypothetical protein [Ulvibacterium sp.]|uniref:hypothetical protein n=1 Tax=Ulvibacterium sp. TaxID=2665914 RepID=UPI003BAA70D3